jgi:hypothetical protein
MEHGSNLHYVVLDSVSGNVGCPRDDQLMGSGHTSGSARQRKIGQAACAFFDCSRHSLRSCRAIPGDVVAD